MKNVGTHKAVRRVPVNSISLTGEVLGQEFESSLERDLIQTFYWSDALDWFQVQPVKVKYKGADGRSRSYTPDLLVSFCRPIDESEEMLRPILCEVKYRDDLIRNWHDLKPKFKAAQAHAKQQGWRFKIFTEDRIRTTYLANIQKLWSYKFAPSHDHCMPILVTALDALDKATIIELIDACYSCDDQRGRGEAIWTVWCMIARKIIHCNIHEPLTVESVVWLDDALRADETPEEDT
tara:strand:- start:1454 stop:2161 length:708 start_codon:yes stop_codon:yes gene_type:complete